MPIDTVTPGATRTSAEPVSVADEILPPAGEPIFSDPDMGHFARNLVRARYGIVAFVTGCVIVAVVLALTLSKDWTARTVLLPTESGEGGFPAELGSIASSFGLQFGFGAASQSDLYPTILLSDALLLRILEDEHVVGTGEAPRRLADILVKREDLAEYEHRQRGLRKLRKEVVAASKDSDTGVVTLKVTTEAAKLSADVANALVAHLEKYLIDMRQVEGGRNRTFLDDRVEAVKSDLVAAEEGLKEFRTANRRVNDSPELLLQQERLRREVLIQEQIFLELQKQKEVAKIEEVKNTPVLSVLDSATPPIRASHPKKVLLVALGFLVGVALSIVWVGGRTVLERAPHVAAALQPLGRDLAFLGRLARLRPAARKP